MTKTTNPRFNGGTITNPLIINGNNASPQAANVTGTLLHIANADSVASGILLDAYGALPFFEYRRAAGTAGAPSAVQNGQAIASQRAFGYGATAYSSAARGLFDFITSENWTDTAQGLFFRLNLTSTGGTTTIEMFRVANNTITVLNNAVTIVNSSALWQSRNFTVATLPGVTPAGQIAFVTDSTLGIIAGLGLVVAGGGANGVPVYSDGTNWRIG